MKISKLYPLASSLVVLFGIVTVLLVAACSKNSNNAPAAATAFKSVTASSSVLKFKTPSSSSFFDCDTCVVSGMYVGTSTPNGGGGTSNSIYSFHENNFVVGRHETYEDGVSFGGYRTNCDSIIWNVNYTLSGSYYLLKGVFSSGLNTISGTFQNLNTPSDYGTFTMSK